LTPSQKKKLVIIGLDGVPYDLLLDLGSNNALMPNLHELLSWGSCVKMRVSLPEISSVSWSSFMTGTDPGNHGIFGFVDLAPGSYDYTYPNFSNLGCPTFFDRLGQAGKRSVIINLPSTYPARKINGVLISGFISLDLQKAVFPPRYYPVLKKMGYTVDIEAGLGKDNKPEFLAELSYMLELRGQAGAYFWEKEEWDCFMLTITGTDRLHHFLYDAYLDPSHRFHTDFLDYYREVDRAIGDITARVKNRQEYELLMLSDHGFGPSEREIYLTPVLRGYGFNKLPVQAENTLADLDESSRVFAMDPNRLYIHRKGKYPRGSVDDADYKIIRKDLCQLFEEYHVDGRPAFQRVYLKEELYSSRYLDVAPDIVLHSNPGFDVKSGLGKQMESGKTHLTGMHRQDNAFLFTTRPELLKQETTIFDIAHMIGAILETPL
jgi:predicted AlkP superfamily phosphohydrolase/phosphomutase